MPWKKNRVLEEPLQFSAPSQWEERERVVSPAENGSSRVVYGPVNSDEINKRQLDPRVVDLQNLIESGITIDPGSVSTMLNLSDPAEIEEYNSSYVKDAYKFLKEHKNEIFKPVESVEK